MEMASKVEGEKLQGLVCPLCLDVFENATILSCGHTFCKECLEAYDEQDDDLDHIVCPVCRRSTSLGQNRIAGLTPNFSVQGLVDKINTEEDGRAPIFCSLHSKVYKDIYCEVCGEFICLTCYLNSHKDHAIRKREELDIELKEKRDNLMRRKPRKFQFGRCLSDAGNQRKDTQKHISTLEKQIRNAFDKKVMILQGKEEILLNRIREIWEGADKEVAEGAWFCPSDEKLLALGHIELAVKAPRSDRQHAMTPPVRRKDDQDPWRTRADIQLGNSDVAGRLNLHVHQPAALKQQSDRPSSPQIERPAGKTTQSPHGQSISIQELQRSIPTVHAMTVVREIELPKGLSGMAALSEDTVVVGYGWNGKGADSFSVSGLQKPYLSSEAGNVYDIALLSNGTSVVSHDVDVCLLFDRKGKQIRGMKHVLNKGGLCPMLCSDREDNIYAVGRSSEINIFHGSKAPKRVVHTGSIKPSQICVTKTGAMITSTCIMTPSTVTVFDRDGHVGSSITASDDNEYLLAAVDSQDSVLVARVRVGSATILLTRYTLQETKLVEQVTFHPLKLRKRCRSFWSYMVSLKPNMLASKSKRSLYFIELAG